MSTSGTPSKQRRTAEHWQKIVERVRTSLASGYVHKLFEDDYFIFELIKLLYQDSVESNVKIEILSAIEQYGSGVLPTNSVDQSVSALLDVFRSIHSAQGQLSVATQLLITVTTIFIENEELMETGLCSTFTSQLVDLISKVNEVAWRRLRGCACQCLVQLETTRPGLLWKWHEVFIKLVKEERTDVGQDYMYLLICVSNFVNQVESSGQHGTREEQSCREEKELLPAISHIMDNVFYLSPAGLSTIACHVVNVLKRCPAIPATVFKPLVLQCLSSLDPCVISLTLYIQGEFHGEIISEKEERVLVQRALQFVRNANVSTNTRLFIAQCLMEYMEKSYSPALATSWKEAILPTIFDPIDVHTCKLDFAVRCCGQGSDSDVSTELHYLTQLAETTGSVRITCSLYHALFSHVTQNCSEEVASLVLSITRKLFQNFPHLIPVIVNFLQAVKRSRSHEKLHEEIVSLLHETVLSLPLKSLLTNYENFLQVWLLSAQDSAMLQQRPLRRLLDLVKEAACDVTDDWGLGCMVLSVCRAVMLHHHTDILYWQLGDLLSYMMNHYGDFDIRDQARFLYAFLTMTSDAKSKEIIGAAVLDGMHLGENIADFFHGSTIQTVPAEIHLLDSSPIKLCRERLEVVYHKDPEKTFRSPSPDIDATAALQEYYEELSHLNTSLKCTFSASLVTESNYDCLVAVAFETGESKELDFSEDVSLVFLDKTESGVVEYSITPKVPGEATMSLRAVFGHDKSTYQCDLDLIQFQLADFLVPFPWHVFNIADKKAFFDQHWLKCTEKNAGTFSGVESIKILKCPRRGLAEVWSNALVLSGSEEESDADDYLFFIPPRFHLMFHARTHATDLVLHIASDYWPTLGQLDQLLDNFTA
ncbi:hypothetical protein EGW08_016384 [Elysia chlorotica]|uniref:AP5B1 middle domain-containing protein n=1 Tax=Elysia chlorotica TaxID=188477 RepID=A0A3S1BAC5_ELYCH|nr:hypothetical protein EGW08_016384 [Elysia chlorotica]